MTSVDYPSQMAKKTPRGSKGPKIPKVAKRARRSQRVSELVPSQVSVGQRIKTESVTAAHKGRRVHDIQKSLMNPSVATTESSVNKLKCELNYDEIYLLWGMLRENPVYDSFMLCILRILLDYLVRIFASGCCNYEPELLGDRNALLEASRGYKGRLVNVDVYYGMGLNDTETEAIASRIKKLELERQNAAYEVICCSERPATQTDDICYSKRPATQTDDTCERPATQTNHIGYTKSNLNSTAQWQPDPTTPIAGKFPLVSPGTFVTYLTKRKAPTCAIDGYDANYDWIQSDPSTSSPETYASYNPGYQFSGSSNWIQSGYNYPINGPDPPIDYIYPEWGF